MILKQSRQFSKNNPFDTMKLFQSLRDFFRAMFLNPHQPNNNNSFQLENGLIFFNFLLSFIFSVGHFFFKANTITERGESYFSTVSQFTSFVYFASYISNIDAILKLIGKYESFVEKRKFKRKLYF